MFNVRIYNTYYIAVNINDTIQKNKEMGGGVGISKFLSSLCNLSDK